jgi:RNA polymerase sigma factor (sigma-70 family)
MEGTLKEEIELVKWCLRNERGAWETFNKRYKNLIWTVINQKLPGEYTKYNKDVIFWEAFEKIVRALYQWRRETRLTTYIGVIVRSVTIDHIRRESRYIRVAPEKDDSEEVSSPVKETPDEDPYDKPIGVYSGVKSFGKEERKIYVKELLNHFSESLLPQEKKFVKLHFLYGWPLEELADFFQINKKAVYTRKCRVLAKLKKIAKTQKLINSKG